MIIQPNFCWSLLMLIKTISNTRQCWSTTWRLNSKAGLLIQHPGCHSDGTECVVGYVILSVVVIAMMTDVGVIDVESLRRNVVDNKMEPAGLLWE
jgi:hypothetical protein